jgi:CRISPR/Cas system CMR-associated protein Cmr3 (group 5 of RAMP superfamily)
MMYTTVVGVLFWRCEKKTEDIVFFVYEKRKIVGVLFWRYEKKKKIPVPAPCSLISLYR